MKKNLVLIGGGGHCKACIDVIEQEGSYQILGILDLPELIGSKVSGYDIIGNDCDYPKFLKNNCSFLITLGHIKSAAKRIKIYNRVRFNR